YLVDQGLVTQDNSTQYPALTIDVFGRTMGNNLGSQFQRILKDGSREAIIDIQDQVVFPGEMSGLFQVYDLQSGIGWGFQQHHFGPAGQGLFPGAVIDAIYIGTSDTKTG